MAYTESKTDWNISFDNSPEQMIRIEENIEALKSEDINIDGNKTFTGDNEWSGDNEFTGGFIADGVTTPGAGATIFSVNLTTSTGSDIFEFGRGFLTITKPSSIYGKITGTYDSTQVPWLGGLQDPYGVINTYKNLNSSDGILGETTYNSGFIFRRSFQFVMPGTYPVGYSILAYNANVTLSLHIFGVFGNDSI